MWLQDLEKALARLKEECDYNFICVEKITPSADGGIVFKTTYHTYVKWFPNGGDCGAERGGLEKMTYVYLVYAECDGLRGIFQSEAGADRRVMEIASNEMDIDTSVAPLDFNSPWRWGWDVCYWRKELVYD